MAVFVSTTPLTDTPIELLSPTEKIERFLAPFDDYERGILWNIRFTGPRTAYERQLWDRAIELHEQRR